jgi:glucose/arabinose dehydrogenase
MGTGAAGTRRWAQHGSVLAALLLACGSETSPPDEATIGLEPVAIGLAFPLALTAPAGDARLFIVEKPGRIRIVRDGTLLARAFLDLSGAVSTGSEQGLLGLAFDPEYSLNGRFYVNYTNTEGDTRIVAYRVSGDPDLADPASADTILPIDQPFSNHNGGHLAFGPDGYLYVGSGDGGSGGDPQGNGQDRTDLLGSLLRLDVSSGSGYAIPPDNPFAEATAARAELWDFGLRNPWRFSFDRVTGDLYIADVGQNEREEINVAPRASGGGRGANYGWSVMEGIACFADADCDSSGLTLPVLEYTHADGCSVTGGFVYRGSALPEISGHYFYADFCEGWVRSFRLSGGSAAELREWPELAPGGQVPGFGEDASGELYVLDAGGTVYRIVRR